MKKMTFDFTVFVVFFESFSVIYVNFLFYGFTTIQFENVSFTIVSWIDNFLYLYNPINKKLFNNNKHNLYTYYNKNNL